MTLTQMIAWVQAGQLLINAGVATVATIRAWISSQHAGMTDAQLNDICDAIIAGATAHKRTADLDTGKIR